MTSPLVLTTLCTWSLAEIRRLSVRERAIGGLTGDSGAVRAAREHALVDQATGWLAGRLDCTVTEASGHLATLAADTGVSVGEAATLLLGDGRAVPVPEQPAPRKTMIPRQAARTRPRRFRNGFALARAKIERERREATLRMQQAILPARERQFRHGEFGIAVRYQPASSGNQVGGDWYESRARAGGGTLVTIGDVAGHGLTAAAGMARIGNALRGMTVTGELPHILLHWLNDLVCTDETPEQVASAAVAVLEPGLGAGPPRLRWAQAGHPPPVLVRDGETRLLARPAGLLLGTLPGANYELTTENLRRGDRLVFYTDGLIERRGRDIDMGLAKLLQAADCCAGAAAGAGADKLAARLSRDGEDDDVTVLVVAVGG